MAKPNRCRVALLLVLASVTCWVLIDLESRVRPPAVDTPTQEPAVVAEPGAATSVSAGSRSHPARKPLAAVMALTKENTPAGPLPARATRYVPATAWDGDWLVADRSVADQTAGGYVVFVDLAPRIPLAAHAWPREKMASLARFYDRAVLRYYAGVRGFGDPETWSEASGVSLVDPIMLFYNPQHPQDPQPTATWYNNQVPVITYGPTIRTQTASHGLQLAVHELAHVWDGAHGWTLSEGLIQVVQNPGNYPTARACDGGQLEDFAESVTAYLIDGYASNARWSDDDRRFYTRFGVSPDEVWALDRYDYVAWLFAGATVAEIREVADQIGTYDIVVGDNDVVAPDR